MLLDSGRNHQSGRRAKKVNLIADCPNIALNRAGMKWFRQDQQCNRPGVRVQYFYFMILRDTSLVQTRKTHAAELLLKGPALA